MDALTIDSFYSEALSGRLTGLRCNSGHVTTPPRHSCEVCKSTTLSVVELSPEGEVDSFTEVFVKSQEFPVETPFVLALTKLKDGPRLLGVLDIQRSAEVRARMKVKIVFRKTEEQSKWPRIFFEPKE